MSTSDKVGSVSLALPAETLKIAACRDCALLRLSRMMPACQDHLVDLITAIHKFTGTPRELDELLDARIMTLHRRATR